MYDGPMETFEYMWVNIRCMLIAPAKIAERKGSITSSFYGQLPDYKSHVLQPYLPSR